MITMLKQFSRSLKLITLFAFTCLLSTKGFATTNCYTVTSIPYSPITPTSPTAVTLGDDDFTGPSPLSIGFIFNYFTLNKTTFSIASNGYISFNSSNVSPPTGNAAFTPAPLPNNATSRLDSIFAYQRDLDPSQGGTITYASQGTAPNRVLLINFNNVPLVDLSATVTFQIILYETYDVIDIMVTSVPVRQAVEGIQNSTGTIAFTVPNRNGTASPAWGATNEGWRFASVPIQPGPISGLTAVCAGSMQTYSIDPILGATSYTWTLPAGWTGSSTTDSISVTTSATSGNISVTANNSCGNSPARTLAVTSYAGIPAQPGAISGPTEPCVGTTQTYSIVADPNAASYIWTLPSGWTGTSTTNSIIVVVGPTAGTITVAGVNPCGTGPVSSLDVTPSFEPAPDPIAGPTEVCEGITYTYSVRLVNNATNYTWTLPAGWTGSSATNVIQATAGSTGGTISVVANALTGCQTVASELEVVVLPTPVGPTNVTVRRVKTEFVDQTVYANRVEWEPSASPQTAFYFIYRNGVLIAEVPATENRYDDQGIRKNGIYSYSVSAVNACGSQSGQVFVAF